METNQFTVDPRIFASAPLLSNAEFFGRIRHSSTLGAFPLFYFGTPSRTLICGMSSPSESLEVLETEYPPEDAYPSLTQDIPAFHIFERELWEEHGITPLGHPWLKPLRFSDPDKHPMTDYPFFASDSPALHEVAVGPVHAGVIEPGHFRFVCHGERVEHLEIQLGYQHRGVSGIFCRDDLRSKISLAESVAGDTAIGHGLAYCLLIEGLCGLEVSPAVHTVRSIALELERIAMHLADLSALCGDIAYLSGQNMFAALRTTIINSSLALCGSRFGKRWLCPGGINYGVDAQQNRTLRLTLEKALEQIELTAQATFANSGVLNRFDSTGSLSLQQVTELNMSGITAKAAGLSRDARRDHPFMPVWEGFEPLTCESGDVYARAYLRYLEIRQSTEMIQYMLSTLPEVKAQQLPLPGLRPDALAVAVTEGWRGRIVHIARTDQDGAPLFYRIYDPSMHNWFGLALAVRGEGISDFPLCNKSFDLSYCGADL